MNMKTLSHTRAYICTHTHAHTRAHTQPTLLDVLIEQVRVVVGRYERETHTYTRAHIHAHNTHKYNTLCSYSKCEWRSGELRMGADTHTHTHAYTQHDHTHTHNQACSYSKSEW